MAKLKWQRIRQALRQQATPPAPLPAKAFWESFRARAALAPRAEDAFRPALPWWHSRPLHLALATAAVLLVAGLWFLPMQTAAPAAPRTMAAVSEVEEVDAFVSYSSMMIMKDEKTRGTIVWFSGLRTNGSDDST